ncbi:MAG TPA: hypothetical protein ENF86_01600 [Firmicutes bacterium]|nr:hypothetical protein [Bacillota bacterium]
MLEFDSSSQKIKNTSGQRRQRWSIPDGCTGRGQDSKAQEYTEKVSDIEEIIKPLMRTKIVPPRR